MAKENIQQSLTAEITDILRERILRGVYGIGEKIAENQIAVEMGVSRTPIRESFKLLEEEGLIDYIPNRGCFAKGFTKQDVEDIYMVRESLESIVTKWAVERIREDEIKELEDQCDLMEFYTKRGDVKKVLELNGSFHNVIYNAARSRFLTQVLNSYKQYLDKTRKLIFYDQTHLQAILEEHRAILEGIKAHDQDAALKAITQHMNNSEKRALVTWNVQG